MHAVGSFLFHSILQIDRCARWMRHTFFIFNHFKVLMHRHQRRICWLVIVVKKLFLFECFSSVHALNSLPLQIVVKLIGQRSGSATHLMTCNHLSDIHVKMGLNKVFWVRQSSLQHVRAI